MGIINRVTEWVRTNPVPTSLIVGGAIMSCYSYISSKRQQIIRRPPNAEEVGKVSRVLLFPLKSVKPMKEGTSLLVDRMGVKSYDRLGVKDRTWMITQENGVMASSRVEPRLVLIQPSMSSCGGFLHLDAPGMPTLKLSTNLNQHNSPTHDVNVLGLHSQAVNCGQEAADWICKYLGKTGYHIVYHPPSMDGRKVTDGNSDIHKAFDDKDRVGFGNRGPILLTTAGSINDVISRVDGRADISLMNFRSNIHIEGPEPYEEDEYDEVFIGEKVVLQSRILAKRCLATAVDTEKGEIIQNDEPFKTLKGYRPKMKGDPCLGIFLGVLQTGEIKVGDVVYATKKKSDVKDLQ